ncbi:hypothetical protein [Streptomyces erythrochromogenes]|uniref:hypothetical protein n=1 Tax=Streptomyces erythrochromogenes TaxID=285574 RepID=UPI0036F77B1E
MASASITGPASEAGKSVAAGPNLTPALAINSASISNVNYSSRSGWNFTVGWNVNFNAFDRNTGAQFETWCDMWEQDSDDDDLIRRGRHLDMPPENDQYHLRITETSSKLHTELGAEEIYFRCFVRNKDTGQQPWSYSPRIQIGV